MCLHRFYLISQNLWHFDIFQAERLQNKQWFTVSNCVTAEHSILHHRYVLIQAHSTCCHQLDQPTAALWETCTNPGSQYLHRSESYFSHNWFLKPWLSPCVGMSECCDSVYAELANVRSTGRHAQYWPSCAELTKWHRNCKVLQILFSKFDLSSTLTAATASAMYFGVKKQINTKM